MNSSEILCGFQHYMCRFRWGRRFRLPTSYVLSPTASSLASRYLGGDVSICDVALGWFHAEGSTSKELGRRKRLPHFDRRPVVRCHRSRDGQSCFWTGLAEGCADSTCGCRRTPLWRERKAFLSATSLGNHAQSCSCTTAAQDLAVGDYALVERLYGATSQPDPRQNRRGLLAR